MFDVTRIETVWGGRPLVLETGKMARQADGAVMVTYGQSAVLCTVVAQKSPREGVDFFPLTVNYEEKAFAAGKTDQLKAIAVGASQVVGKLIDVARAIVHGSEAPTIKRKSTALWATSP